MALYIGNRKVTGIQSVINGTVEWGSIEGTLSNQTDLQNALNNKQSTLVSGTNIKTINNNSILGEGNLSIEGITVDQTYDGTSSNAQSGVAISGAKFLKNKATGTSSLSILGSASSGTACTNIGVGSLADKNGTALGYGSSASAEYGGLSLGYQTGASGYYSIAIGSESYATASRSIQLGTGSNSTANSLFCGFGAQTNYKMLDGTTGLIPQERLVVPVNTLDQSGSILLSDNSINTITPTGSVTFTLPSITNNTIYHQILIQVYLTDVFSITLGTSYYFNETPPDMSSTGVYTIIYEYNVLQQYWVVGALKIGTSQ